MQSLGNAIGLPITFMPQRVSGRHQTFVHGNDLRIGYAIRDSLFALQFDSRTKQAVCPSIPTKKRTPRRKIILSGLFGYQLPVRVVGDEAKLGRFALLAFEYSDSDQMLGTSEYHIPVAFPGDRRMIGNYFHVTAKSVEDGRIVGVID